ncbi:response regulator [Horticoccus luteus]|uniref:Response regulator n=1 Tax=Horticoccus luteus TaxID=2862869 RepID=A0A8F9XGE0_9BACT|nr:response regulator [Horticoccus luteus]QYM79087.1 response regulator [Horticoccus luteus]
MSAGLLNPLAPLLLVEDNEDDVFFMQRALRLAGNTRPVRIAGDGQAALDYLAGCAAQAKEHVAPAAVFLDLKLPYIYGLDVLAAIRAHPAWHDLAVFILTSSAENSDRARAETLGIRRYLVKPPTPETLRPVLAELTPTALAANAPQPASSER